jgi:hypothetical protein
MKIKAYTRVIEAQIRYFYKSLSEKKACRYTFVEASKLGYGRETYISDVLEAVLKTLCPISFE